MIIEEISVSPGTISNDTLFESIKKLGPYISQFADSEQADRKLSKEVVDTLLKAGLYRLFVPTSLGGIETDPVTVAILVEKLAMFNTAAAWSMMVANTGAWFFSRFPSKAVDLVYKNGPDVFLAGAVHPPMKATPVKSGYKISGRTPLVSNIHEAAWVFVSALVMENNQPKFNKGIPEVIGVFMNSGDCKIIDTWYTIGMRGTDSNDVEASNVFVPDFLSFPFDPGFQATGHYSGGLYKFPAVGIAGPTLIAPIAISVATCFIKEFKNLAAKKTSFGSVSSLRERGTVQRKLGMAQAMVQSSRAYLHHVLRESWNKISSGEILSLEEKGNLLLAGTHVNQSCFQAIDMLYTAAGTTAIYTSHKLAQYFTDAQVIRQHGFANESRYETFAQIELGLPPDLPLVVY